MAAPNRTRLYREFLTPALHRRFTRAAAISLVICYLTAVLIGEKTSCTQVPPLIFCQVRCWKKILPTRVMVAPNRANWHTNSFALHLLPFGICSSCRPASFGSKKYNVVFCDIHKVPLSIQYGPNLMVVPFLCMVVWRGLYLVRFRPGQFRLVSEVRVRAWYWCCHLRLQLMGFAGLGKRKGLTNDPYTYAVCSWCWLFCRPFCTCTMIMTELSFLPLAAKSKIALLTELTLY